MPVPLFRPAARCKKARRQRRGYGGLEVVCRRQTRGGDLRGLRRVILPVVIRAEKRSISIAQCQRMKPAMTMLSTRADEGARAQVGQFRVNSLVEVVDFDQGDT